METVTLTDNEYSLALNALVAYRDDALRYVGKAGSERVDASLQEAADDCQALVDKLEKE